MPTRSRHLRCEMLEDRLTPSSAGDLDPTFGTGGKSLVSFGQTTQFGDFTRATTSAMALQPAGGIILVGNTSDLTPGSQESAAVVRLTPEGTLDTTFGQAGRVTGVFDPAKFGGSPVPASAAAVQPDGKTVVVGTTSQFQFAVARLNPDGALDPTFGNGGSLLIPLLGEATAVAIQPDGKIVLGGAKDYPRVNDVVNSDFALVRLNPDGTPDNNFGSGGEVFVPFDLGAIDKMDTISAVLIQPDGKIVAVGSAGLQNKPNDAHLRTTNPMHAIAVARVNADGSPDQSFGTGGKVVVKIDRSGFPDDTASAAFLQPDGRIVVVGGSANLATDGSIFPPASPPPQGGDFAVVRLNPDGSLDTSFGNGGKVDLPINADAGTGGGGGLPPINTDVEGLDSAAAVALQPQGKILVAGSASVLPRPSSNLGGSVMAVVRLDGGASGPGTVLVGGRPDGTAVTLAPTGGQYAVTDSFTFFPGFPGPVRTATADVTGDGVADYIGGAGPGGGPNVIVLDGKTGAKVASFFAFESSFTGGVFVAAADLTGDGRAEVIVTPDQGGGPVVAVFDGAKLAGGQSADASQLARFLGIDDPAFRGGARPAVGDVSGDGTPDLLVSAGFLGGPRIALYDGGAITGDTPVKLVPDFFAFEDSLRNGAFVAAGDVTGDGKADLAFGGGPGGAPRVRVFDAAKLLAAGSFGNLDSIASAAQVANFFAGDASSRGGVRLAMRDADGDGKADLITGSGEGEPAQVRVYKSATLLSSATPSADQTLAPFGGTTLANGVFVG